VNSKFDVCLQELTKEASEVTRAGGLRRVGQLLTGSRARALEERAEGVAGAGRRALESWRNPESTHNPVNTSLRYLANEAASQRALRAAQVERSGVRGARGLGAGVLGAGTIGAASMLGGDEPTAADPGAPLPKKSPLLAGAKVLGTSLAGFGLGQLAGVGIGKGIEAVTRRQGGDPVEIARKVAPIVGTAAGIIYPIWRGREQKGISDAVQGARDENERRLPGQ
jgi:hypothetical protein